MIETILGGLASVFGASTAGGAGAAGAGAIAGVAGGAEAATAGATAVGSVTGGLSGGATGATATGLGSSMELLSGSKSLLQVAGGNMGAELGSNALSGFGPIGEHIGTSVGEKLGLGLTTPNQVPATFGENLVSSDVMGSLNQPLTNASASNTPSYFGEVTSKSGMIDMDVMSLDSNLANKSYDMTGGALEKATQADKSFGKFVSETMPNGNYNITRELTPYERAVYQGPEKAKDALKYAAGQKIKKEVGKAFTPNKVAQAQGRGYEDGQRGSGVQQAQRQLFNMYDNYYKQVGGIR